jgi:hypothetical protein
MNDDDRYGYVNQSYVRHFRDGVELARLPKDGYVVYNPPSLPLHLPRSMVKYPDLANHNGLAGWLYRRDLKGELADRICVGGQDKPIFGYSRDEIDLMHQEMVKSAAAYESSVEKKATQFLQGVLGVPHVTEEN